MNIKPSTDLMLETKLATEVAKKAGIFLKKESKMLNKELVSSGKDIKLKADIQSEKLITDLLTERSSYPILGEESGKSHKNLQSTFWVVDPLDGTANYSRNLPLCGVSIALIKDDVPILGVIYDFNNEILYKGSIHEKATANNEIISVSNRSSKKESILVTGLPVAGGFDNQTLRKFFDNCFGWGDVRLIGSAVIASIYVASGRAECYEEKGIFLWDIAAGYAIVNAAGGTSIISNSRENFQVDIVFTNGKQFN